MPVQRGNISLTNLQVFNAILYVAENGCKWCSLPKQFGNWRTIYTRMNRWAKAGVLDRLFEELQHHQLVWIKIEAMRLDSTIVKVHPDCTGALKKRTPVRRQIASRMDFQNSYGCRGCSMRHRVLVKPWTSGRRARGTRVDTDVATVTASLPIDHGSRISRVRTLLEQIHLVGRIGIVLTQANMRKQHIQGICSNMVRLRICSIP